MQKVAVGRIGGFKDFEYYLNQQLKKNPGWRVEQICSIDLGVAGPAVVIIYEGPDDTEGPSVRSDEVEEEADDEDN